MAEVPLNNLKSAAADSRSSLDNGNSNNTSWVTVTIATNARDKSRVKNISLGSRNYKEVNICFEPIAVLSEKLIYFIWIYFL